MRNYLRKCSNNLWHKVFYVLKLPFEMLLFCIRWAGYSFEQIEKFVELLLLWLSLFPITWEHVNNKHFLSGTPTCRKSISCSSEALDLTKVTIERMASEYEDRKKVSSEKIKILFQTITFIFTIETGLIAYLYKDNKASMSLFFIASIALLTISLFMIICYYKVSASNSLSFDAGDKKYNYYEYYSDLLFCIEMNNRRLDYFVTIYKSAIRYFIAALVCLMIAIVRQFYSTVIFI